MQKLTKEDLLKSIEEMTVLELSELTKALEEKFGVSASMLSAGNSQVNSTGSSPTAVDQAEEKSSFNVVLEGGGSQKFAVIKALRTFTELGLKEAKELVEESDSHPKEVKNGLSKEEAEKIQKLLLEAGAKVKLT